jgi:hypothetical protein
MTNSVDGWYRPQGQGCVEKCPRRRTPVDRDIRLAGCPRQVCTVNARFGSFIWSSTFSTLRAGTLYRLADSLQQHG